MRNHREIRILFRISTKYYSKSQYIVNFSRFVLSVGLGDLAKRRYL